MKTIALFTLALVLTLVGCSPQGGTSDEYNTDRGRSSTNIAPSTPDTNNGAKPGAQQY